MKKVKNHKMKMSEIKSAACYSSSPVVKYLTVFFMTLVITLSIRAQKNNAETFNNLDANGVILDGYDPVAFFTDNKPVKGDMKYQYKYDGAVYYFALLGFIPRYLRVTAPR